MFSWSCSADVLRVEYRGVAFAELVLSLSARLSGLFVGEVLRERVLTTPVREAMGLFPMLLESTLNVRLSPDGDRGAGDIGAFGEAGPRVVNRVNRDGFDGDRDSERRICRMVLKPS